MTVVQREALAILKALFRVAVADGYLKESERLAIAALAERMRLPQEVSIENLVVEESQLEDLLAEVKSPEARTALYESASEMANIDGEASPEEQAMLEKIRVAFELPEKSGT